jgi:hypothetical protein
MWKIFIITAACWSIVGCTNDNQILIQNDTGNDFNFNFRAESYTSPAGKVTPITEIPNGTFSFEVSIVPPDGYTLGTVPATDELIFQQKSSKWRLIYSSSSVNGIYNVTLSKTTSDGSTTVTSP